MTFSCCPRVDALLNLATYSAPEKELAEEFGLRTSVAPVESITRQETNRCFQISGTIILLLASGVAAIVLCREYLGSFLFWLSHLPGWHGPFLFCILFIVVSFPMMWGYIILNLGAGYIYGMLIGSIVTAVGANLGALVSFVVCRRLWKDYVLQKLSAYENLKQIVRVIEGRQGFRIIMMTRLTPVPFGLQNALFSTAKIGKVRFITATAIGLLPTQLLNTYMGTTLRSMEDVMAGKSSNTIVLIAQIVITLAVTYVVNVRMKHEVHTVCEQESTARAKPADPSLHRVLSMQALPVQVIEDDAAPLRSHSVVFTEDLEAQVPLAPLPTIAMPEPTTSGGQFVRGHRRSQSAGPILKSKELIIKLQSSLFGNR